MGLLSQNILSPLIFFEPVSMKWVPIETGEQPSRQQERVLKSPRLRNVAEGNEQGGCVVLKCKYFICEWLESKKWMPLSLLHLCNTLFLFKMCPLCLEPQNRTGDSEFLLLGLSGDPDLQPLLFGLFLSAYLVTVLGNLLLILAVIADSRLHTPMYFLLSSLSLSDISFSTTTVPKMLANLQTHSKSITYAGCLTQVTVFPLFACLDSLLLAVMAYDRLVAICQPLHYPIIRAPASVACWSCCHFSSAFWTPSCTT